MLLNITGDVLKSFVSSPNLFYTYTMCATSRIMVEQDFLLRDYYSLVILSILFSLWQDWDICDYSGIATI